MILNTAFIPVLNIDDCLSIIKQWDKNSYQQHIIGYGEYTTERNVFRIKILLNLNNEHQTNTPFLAIWLDGFWGDSTVRKYVAYNLLNGEFFNLAFKFYIQNIITDYQKFFDNFICANQQYT